MEVSPPPNEEIVAAYSVSSSGFLILDTVVIYGSTLFTAANIES